MDTRNDSICMRFSASWKGSEPFPAGTFFSFRRVQARISAEAAPVLAGQLGLQPEVRTPLGVAKPKNRVNLLQRACVSVASNNGRDNLLFALRIIEEGNHAV